MFPAPYGYDRAITVFSPDGRIFQVEYALETVKRGSTVVGIVCKEGSVLAAEERLISKLQDMKTSLKIFQIDDHLGAAISGLSADARVLIDHARVLAQSNKLLFDEPVDVEVLVKRIGDLMQIYTQHAGLRPFGVSILFSGADKTGCRLFQLDPGGSYFSFKATALGAGSAICKEILEAEYRDDMSLKDSILLALKCLKKSIEGKLQKEIVTMALIPLATKKFRFLEKEEIDEYIKELEKSDPQVNDKRKDKERS